MSDIKQIREHLKFKQPKKKELVVEAKQEVIVENSNDAIKARLLSKALDQFAQAARSITADWDDLNDSGELGSDHYPFKHSFEETVPEIDKWVRAFKQELQKVK